MGVVDRSVTPRVRKAASRAVSWIANLPISCLRACTHAGGWWSYPNVMKEATRDLLVAVVLQERPPGGVHVVQFPKHALDREAMGHVSPSCTGGHRMASCCHDVCADGRFVGGTSLCLTLFQVGDTGAGSEGYVVDGGRRRRPSAAMPARWVVGAIMNMSGNIIINFGTNLMKLGHNNKRHALEEASNGGGDGRHAVRGDSTTDASDLKDELVSHPCVVLGGRETEDRARTGG